MTWKLVHMYPSLETRNPLPEPRSDPLGRLSLLGESLFRDRGGGLLLFRRRLLLFLLLLAEGSTDRTRATEGPHFRTTPVIDRSPGVRSFSSSSTDTLNADSGSLCLALCLLVGSWKASAESHDINCNTRTATLKTILLFPPFIVGRKALCFLKRSTLDFVNESNRVIYF